LSASFGSGHPTGGCIYSSFVLPKDNANPRGSTPLAALDAFLTHGTTQGSVPPVQSLAKSGYPASGWHVVQSPWAGVTFGSGNYQLVVGQLGDGSWLINGGAKFC
jgi:hypothetical protein